jgi:tRNA(Ile)-lysidine synthase
VPSDEGSIGHSGGAGFQHGVSIDGPQSGGVPKRRYDPGVRTSIRDINLDTSQFAPGLRLAVGLSGGADSVALVRSLAARSRDLGLVLQAAHLHHGLRGEEADADRDFCRELAAQLNIAFHESTVDTAAEARPDPDAGKDGETVEEAARRLRYAWFRDLMRSRVADAVATAHTRDDQAETVLAKFLRGAWTEGLSGIHPVLRFEEGRILRPLLGITRAEIEAYLRGCGQNWREDSTNRHLMYTRNRIRHELLPLLETWNPKLKEHLAQMAELAREENAWWAGEVSRAAEQILLPGRPVRGGGRAAGEGLALEFSQLAGLSVPLQRRILRFAAGKLGVKPDFDGTEALRNLALTGRAGQKCEISGLKGERTHRELRLSVTAAKAEGPETGHEFTFEIPGQVVAPEWGIRVAVNLKGIQIDAPGRGVLRTWKGGDRVRLRYSGGPRKVKEVLERMHVSGTARANWPVLEVDGRIVWMRGVQLEPEPGIEIAVTSVE